MYYRIRIRETYVGLWCVSVAEIALGAHGVKERDLHEGDVEDKPSPVQAVRSMLDQLGWSDIPASAVLAAAEDRVSITIPSRWGASRPTLILCPRMVGDLA